MSLSTALLWRGLAGIAIGIVSVVWPGVTVGAVVWIDRRRFDHASIPKTVRVPFGFEENWLSQRDRVATDLLNDVDGLPLLDEPRDDPLEFVVTVPEDDAQTATTKELNQF
jgi:hypothetical protein